MKTAILAICGVATIPALRQAIKSYRAHKAIKDVAVDALEAAIDAVDKP
jgi:hypothetical protein